MQLWQQQLIQKQSQELQRQQQFQQLERGVRQQNFSNQLATSRQGVQNQLPPLLNGMPINKSSSYMLQNDITGANANSSNMFMIPSNHGQAMHMQTGFAPQQQFDQSLYGTPVSSSRGLMGQYPQFQGMSNNYTDALAKVSVHPFTGQNVQAQEYENLHNQTGWSKNMEQKPVMPSRAVTSLDPEEEKILFGTHDASNLGSFLNNDSSENGDTFGAFSSLNSGSWSALMQDAVQSSTSDKGFHEEWSGLNFPKPESSTANSNQVTWDNNSNNSQNVSVRPLPRFSEPGMKSMFNIPIQPQNQSNDASCGVWTGNMHDQSIKYSEGSRSLQESIPLFSTGNQPESNRISFAQNGGNMSTSMDTLQFNNPQPIPFSTKTSNSNQEIDQHALNRYHHDHGRVVAFNSSAKARGETIEEFKLQKNKGQQVQESSMNSADPSQSLSDSQTSSGISGWKSVGPSKFQSPKDTAHSASLPRAVIQQRKNQEQGYMDNSNLKKEHAYIPEELQHRSSMSRHPSQNILHREDKPNIPIPSSEQQSVSNHDLQSHTSLLSFNSRQLNSELVNKDQMQSDSTGFNNSLHHPNEASQIENVTIKPDTFKQKCNVVSSIISERNSSANNASNLSYMGQQIQMWKQQQLLQQQQLLHQHLPNPSNHGNHVNHPIFTQAQISQIMATTNQSGQTPMPTVSGRTLPFNVDSSSNIISIDTTMQAQQIEPPPMLHNVWTNISARGSHELGTYSQSSQQFVEGDKISPEESSLNGADSETCSASQDQEKPLKSPSYIKSPEHSNLPPTVQQQINYSLLKQMQAKRAIDTLSPGIKVLNFSSRENEEECGEKYAPNIQNPNPPPSLTSHFIGKSEKTLLTPQMAHSLFEQNRNYNYANFAAMGPNLIINSKATNETSPQLQSGATNNTIVLSKKRRIERTELQPWHQVVLLGVQGVQNISNAEHRWAEATNRLIEKVEDVIEDSSFMPRARRRLTLTTELMQKLVPPIAATILAAKVSSGYESVTYITAKLAMGDACGLICSCSRSDYGEEKEDSTSEKHKTSKNLNEEFFSKVVEEFSERSKKLESIFSRLDKRTSILETRLEWQEVDKFSLINRLGKIHARNQQGEAVAESGSPQNSAAPRKLVQRFVTGYSTTYVPQGVQCLSL